jgi:hypothetical protein
VRAALALPLLAVAVGLVALVAGCSTPQAGSNAAPKVPPVRLAALLPTAAGLREATASRAADAAAIQAALAGKADASAARKLTELGLQRGAIRTWTTAKGGRMTVVVSVWDNHTAATSVGGDSAELTLGTSGARAWTPTELGASRGVRNDQRGRQLRTLSYAVDATDLFVRAEGPIPEQVVVRAVQRMVAALGAGEAPKG